MARTFRYGLYGVGRIGQVHGQIVKDDELYPQFSDEMMADLRTSLEMFLDDIVALKDRFTARFQIIYTFSREQSDTPLFNRRLDGAMLDILIENGLVDVRQHDAAYVCGPHGMIVDMEARL